MKKNYITHIVLEGSDGVGKSTVCSNIWRKYDGAYRVQVRGDISDYVYSKVYGRDFSSTERGLPFLYVLLTKDEKELRKQILDRAAKNSSLESELFAELEKVSEQKLFIAAAKAMKNDYHILHIDTSRLSIEKTINKVLLETTAYINALPSDREYNEFNKMYQKGCEQLNIDFAVKDNQPFFNNKKIMADAQLHNGFYETFDIDTFCPHNLIFSCAYKHEFLQTPKTIDFSYPINSKILVRPEIREYFDKFVSAGLTVQTSNTQYVDEHPLVKRFDKCFGDEYIAQISKSNATVYCARDLSYLEMMTVRPYEATLASQVLFVDSQSDPDCKILEQIHNNALLVDKLYCSPNNIVEKYLSLTVCEIDSILLNQQMWYSLRKHELFHDCLSGSFMKSKYD